jgi:Asp/Glu/hydantoin racemase
VAALREIAGVPVIGLAEASLREAAGYGRHAIVTGGLAWRPMLQRFAAAQGLDRDLAGVHVLERSGAELMADPQAAERDLLAALREAATEGVGALVLGGAALGGIAARLGSRLPVPVIDSVQAGARAVNESLRASRVISAELSLPAKVEARVVWSGLSDELLAALTRGVDLSATAHPSHPRGG